MKKIFRMMILVGLMASTTFVTSCSEDSSTTPEPPAPPVVTVTFTKPTVSVVSDSSATFNTNLTVAGIPNITERGFCYGTSVDPTTANAKVFNGNTIGQFTNSIADLIDSTLYHVRAYAKTSTLTYYSDDVPFTTKSIFVKKPIVNNIGYTTAKFTSDDLIKNSKIIERGFCYGESINPTIDNSTIKKGIVVDVSDLNSGKVYRMRAYVKTNAHVYYSSVVEFITSTVITTPTVTTNEATNITTTTATCIGNVTADGGSSVTARGICYSISTEPTTANSTVASGTGTGSFTANLSGLTANTTYYVRAYATNSMGTVYGNQITIVTPKELAVGDEYQGGVIFYLDATGQHGLIAAKSDIPAGVVRFNPSPVPIPAGQNTLSTFGSGSDNTKKLVGMYGSPSVKYAAKECDDYTNVDYGTGVYSDWYLPSKLELIELYNKLYKEKNNIGNFNNVEYWSSTAYEDMAFYVKFSVPKTEGNITYTRTFAVRPIRSF